MPAILPQVVAVASLEGDNTSQTKIFADGKYYPYQIAYSDSLSNYEPHALWWR